MAFDPLHKWLGIPPNEQPPNHYRLLGIATFEKDRDVIDAAADKQLTFLHDMTNGPHAAEAEELSNRVSAARICLCNPKKKSAYDAKIRGEKVPAPPPKPQLSAAAGKPSESPAGDASGSQQAGWYLKHKDGVVHGPFPFQGLTEAAKRGHVASTTMVKHELVTSDQWIEALSLPKLAEACPVKPAVGHNTSPGNLPPDNVAATSPMPVASGTGPVLKVSSPRSSTRRSTRGNGMSYVASIVPGILLILLAFIVYRNPRLRAGIAGLLSPQTQAVEPEVEVRVIQPQRAPRPSAPRRPASKVPDEIEPEEDEPPASESFVSPSIPDRTFQFPDTLGLNEGTEHRFKLDLESQRWADPIADGNRSQRIEIVRVENATSQVTYDPPTAELSFDRDVRVTFAALEGFAMILRLSEVGPDKQVTLTGRYESERGTPFRWTTFKKQQKVASDALRQAEFRVQSLTVEQTKLNNFIRLGADKRLSTYRAAQDRLRVIRTELPAAQSLLLTQRKRWQQILPVIEEAEALNTKGELVIRTLDPESTSPNKSTDSADG